MTKARLRLDEYQKLAVSADQTPNEPLPFHLLGLFGEAGSLLSVAKKKQRDSRSYIGYTPNVVEELGDVLWYFAVVANREGIRLSDIGASLGGHTASRSSRQSTLGFDALQGPLVTASPRQKPTKSFERTLVSLAGDVGAVLAENKAGNLTNNPNALAGSLVRVMRTLGHFEQ